MPVCLSLEFHSKRRSEHHADLHYPPWRDRLEHKTSSPGATDIPLNQNGIEAARLTAEALKEIPFDEIYTSPLQRAVQTAEIMRGDRRIPIIKDERLKEISFGPYEGLCCGKEGYSIPDPEFVNFFQNPAHYNPPEGGRVYRPALCADYGFPDGAD